MTHRYTVYRIWLPGDDEEFFDDFVDAMHRVREIIADNFCITPPDSDQLYFSRYSTDSLAVLATACTHCRWDDDDDILVEELALPAAAAWEGAA